jgi:hypothetical protein
MSSMNFPLVCVTIVELFHRWLFDTRYQVKLCALDNLNPFGNSCVLERQKVFASLTGNSVRASFPGPLRAQS